MEPHENSIRTKLNQTKSGCQRNIHKGYFCALLVLFRGRATLFPCSEESFRNQSPGNHVTSPRKKGSKTLVRNASRQTSQRTAEQISGCRHRRQSSSSSPSSLESCSVVRHCLDRLRRHRHPSSSPVRRRRHRRRRRRRRSFVRSFVRPFVRSFVRSFVRPFVRSFVVCRLSFDVCRLSFVLSE